jgi:hypothetical protein
MIRANLPTFFVILVLIIGAVWIVVNWSYSGVLATKNGQIELQDRQLADYKEKLSGATPDQAKARIDVLEARLEARLAAVEPRRLTADQRVAMIARLSPRPGTTPTISIASEGAGDSPQFGADFASVFRSVGGWNVTEAQVMGIGNRPASGIAINAANINSPEVYAVSNALRAANLAFDIKQVPMREGVAAELLICTKIER